MQDSVKCQNYVLQTSVHRTKVKCFTSKNARSKLYSSEIITDADYVEDLALHENTQAQAECLLHSLKQTEI